MQVCTILLQIFTLIIDVDPVIFLIGTRKYDKFERQEILDGKAPGIAADVFLSK